MIVIVIPESHRQNLPNMFHTYVPTLCSIKYFVLLTKPQITNHYICLLLKIKISVVIEIISLTVSFNLKTKLRPFASSDTILFEFLMLILTVTTVKTNWTFVASLNKKMQVKSHEQTCWVLNNPNELQDIFMT